MLDKLVLEYTVFGCFHFLQQEGTQKRANSHGLDFSPKKIRNRAETNGQETTNIGLFFGITLLCSCRDQQVEDLLSLSAFDDR